MCAVPCHQLCAVTARLPVQRARFQGADFDCNLQLVDRVKQMATEKAAASGQYAPVHRSARSHPHIKHESALSLMRCTRSVAVHEVRMESLGRWLGTASLILAAVFAAVTLWAWGSHIPLTSTGRSVRVGCGRRSPGGRRVVGSGAERADRDDGDTVGPHVAVPGTGDDCQRAAALSSLVSSLRALGSSSMVYGPAALTAEDLNQYAPVHRSARGTVDGSQSTSAHVDEQGSTREAF